MDTVTIDGKMGENMKVCIKKIKKTVMDVIHGQMKENMMDNGLRVNKMVMVSIQNLVKNKK